MAMEQKLPTIKKDYIGKLWKYLTTLTYQKNIEDHPWPSEILMALIKDIKKFLDMQRGMQKKINQNSEF